MVESDRGHRINPPRIAVLLSVLDLIKSALWPGFALVLLMCFYGPFYQLAVGLPDLLGRADVITIGQLDIKLNAGQSSN